jgi:Zn-dependent protease/CBS domain-containing protein
MLSRGIDLGRIFGIRVGLDWSLIVIFLLVTFNLGAGLFPAWHPEWDPLLRWGVALGAAVLFFLSVLVHELSHALVARAYDIPVRRITLFLFGGVADIEEEPTSPKAEALMAGVGPVVSIALGIGFSALAGLMADVPPGAAADPERAMQQMGPLGTLLAWLGPVNIIVGIFNSIPAFPLDGGRVLHAGLWAVTRDLDKSTRWSSLLGQFFGWLLIVTGIAMAFGVNVPFFGRGLVGGIWLAFIGWFLSSAAAMSYRQRVIRGVLEDIPASRLVRRETLPALGADQPVSRFVDEIIRNGQEAVMVTEDARGVGFVHARDVRKVERSAWDTTPLGQIATPIEQLPAVDANDDAYKALQRMSRGDFDQLAVVENGELRGFIRQQDLLRWVELQTADRGARPRTPVYGR